MASCDVQATSSDDNLEDDAAKVGTKIETRTSKSGIVLQPTKIPGPVSLDNSGSYVLTSTRKYTSLMKSLQTKSDQDDSFSSTSTLVNIAEDSGVHMDCSTADDENCRSDSPIQPSSSTPRLVRCIDTIETNSCDHDLDVEEQQTLKVLQRAVAEMEADVALHAEILEAQMKLDLETQSKLQIEEQFETDVAKNLLLDAMEQHHLIQESLQESLQESQCVLPMESLQESMQEMMQKLQLEPLMQQSDSEEMCEHIEQAQNVSDPASARERKHVRVEDLLQAEHDIELLHKLLQTDGNLDNVKSAELPQSTNELVAPNMSAGKELESFDNKDAEWIPKRVNVFHSLFQIICGKGIRKLSYPILFCGMAVGLIYYFRKD